MENFQGYERKQTLREYNCEKIKRSKNFLIKFMKFKTITFTFQTSPTSLLRNEPTNCGSLKNFTSLRSVRIPKSTIFVILRRCINGSTPEKSDTANETSLN